MRLKKVLVADDDPLIRSFLDTALKRLNKEVTIAKDGEEAISFLQKEQFDIILTDMKMPKKNGLQVLQEAKKKSFDQIILIMTAYGSIENAVEAMGQGAFHYLIKPFTIEALEAVLQKAEEHHMLLCENESLKKEISLSTHAQAQKIIAQSPPMKKLLKDIPKIAASNASVFIYGESGTGKEVIAQAIHYNSPRAEFPFISVNCAAIGEGVIESEFFGHEKGAFTGAIQKRIGRFELANRGTLLLDEVTEIPLTLQAKLLRAIQEQVFEKVGSEESTKVDVRIIATSNRNMQEAIEQKMFREDLYYRLNVVPIYLHPLRERKEDILPLAEYFLEKFTKKNQRERKKISEKAKERLLTYSWPGNIRELANIIERVVVLDLDTIIQADHLFINNTCSPLEGAKTLSLEDLEKKWIIKTLDQEKTKTKAAALLGISLRTLHNKLKKYKLPL